MQPLRKLRQCAIILGLGLLLEKVDYVCTTMQSMELRSKALDQVNAQLM
jgi:hypothetical protein